MTQLLNIGLGPICQADEGSRFNALEAIGEVLALHVWRSAIFELAVGPEEVTLVVTSRQGWSDEEIDKLCTRLKQDCIAVLQDREGRLVGPNTEQYQPFDINKFRFGGD